MLPDAVQCVACGYRLPSAPPGGPTASDPYAAPTGSERPFHETRPASVVPGPGQPYAAPPPTSPYDVQPYSAQTPCGAPAPYGGSPYTAYGGQPPGYPPLLPETSGFAIAALVSGLLWLCGIGSIMAVIFGALGLNETRDGRQRGRGLAVAGLVLGVAGVLLTAVSIIASFSQY